MGALGDPPLQLRALYELAELFVWFTTEKLIDSRLTLEVLSCPDEVLEVFVSLAGACELAVLALKDRDLAELVFDDDRVNSLVPSPVAYSHINVGVIHTPDGFQEPGQECGRLRSVSDAMWFYLVTNSREIGGCHWGTTHYRLIAWGRKVASRY